MLQVTMAFCYQNCSDLLWKQIVLVIEKNFWNSRLNFVILSVPFSSKFILGVLMAMNLASFINVHTNGILQGYSSNNNLVGKLMLMLCIFCGSLIRIASMILYFAPTLGLFNLLHHYQGRLLFETNVTILLSFHEPHNQVKYR